MTRFEKELSGALGAYWKKEAEKELEILTNLKVVYVMADWTFPVLLTLLPLCWCFHRLMMMSPTTFFHISGCRKKHWI